MEKQLLTQIRLATDNTTLSSQLITEREFRFFLLKLLDEPENYSDFINTITPYLPSELGKLVLTGPDKNAFAKLLRIFAEGELPLSIKAPLTDAERKEFLLSLLPETMPKTRDQIMKLKSVPNQLFESFAHTFMYYQNLEEENEELSQKIKNIISLKSNSSEKTDSFMTTARSFSKSLPQYSASSTRPTTSSSLRSMNTTSRSLSKGLEHTETMLQTTRTVSLKPTTLSTRGPERIRVGKTTTFKPKQTQPQSARKGKDVFQPTVCKFVRTIDVNTARQKSNEELREILNERKDLINANKKESTSLKKKISETKREILMLEDEVTYLESQAKSLEEKAKERQMEQLQQEERERLLLIRRKKEANKATQELKRALDTNKELKRKIEELQTKLYE